jgi:hypothetical protein
VHARVWSALGHAFDALLVRYVTGQTRVCVKRYRRLLATASRTITSRSCLHVLPTRVEARAVANWRMYDPLLPAVRRGRRLGSVGSSTGCPQSLDGTHSVSAGSG